MELFVQIPEFKKFVKERFHIAIKRQNDLPKPWSKDPIFQQYRFCNVFREWDSVTQWIAREWREPHGDDRDLWFSMVVARLVNWPETLEYIGYQNPWNPLRFRRRMLQLLEDEAPLRKVYTGAYMVRSDKMPKHEYLANILTEMWEDRALIRPCVEEPLEAFYARLISYRGMGSFMAAQVVADMKYAPIFQGAEDWWTFAASGPGSRRGLNRLVGVEVEDTWTEENWRRTLASLHQKIGRQLVFNKVPYPFHAQDLQNCLCEFDKYERVRLGQGRPRSNFNGGSNEDN